MYHCIFTLGCISALFSISSVNAIAQTQEHGFAQSGDVKIHYVSQGEGPLMVLIHGFPDFWYSWRHQMPVLAKHFQVVAIDQRGYNKSDQPEGVKSYTTDKLVDDVKAVVEHFKAEEAVIVGHDWGGFVAWSFAMKYPSLTQKLIVLNMPHPWSLQRELATNPDQAKNSQYARNFQMPGAHKLLTAKGLADLYDEDAKPKYVEAFERSSMEGMLNYYKANYPRQPYEIPDADPPLVKCPVLIIHGLGDIYLLSAGLNDSWKWVEKELTIVTIPNAKHFVQHDAPKRVNDAMLRWLKP